MNSLEEASKGLTSQKWHYVHKRPRSVFYQYVLTLGACLHNNKKISFPYEIPMIGIDYNLALGQAEWDNLNILVQKEIEKNNNFLVDLMRDSYELNKNIEEFCFAIEKMDLSALSGEELITYWNQYILMLSEVGAYVIFPLFAEKYLESKLQEEIKNKFPTEADKVFQILTTPIKPGVIQKEEESLLSLAVSVAKGENIDEQVKSHLREFAWIKNNRFDGNFYQADEVMTRVNLLAQDAPEKKLENFQAKFAKTRADFDNYLNYFADDKEVLAHIDTLQEAIFFRSWRTERYYRNAYFLQNFFAETATRLGLKDKNDIFHLKADEILEGLKDGLKVTSEVIKERSEGYVLYSDFDKVYIFSGDDAKILGKLVKFDDNATESEIKGMVAFPGKVTGKARIILSISELDKVQPGDILVTNSTTPDFVPVFKKIVGIVTEEGGVLSHASVISRELHIPCIIGTKTATKVLKDGDTVEIDTEKGIVRIIK